MGHYIKYETYLPTSFEKKDGTLHQIDGKEIRDFCSGMIRKFQGLTESNPINSPPLKGWWTNKGIKHADRLIHIFSLVKIEQEDEARIFFERWKEKLEKRFKQQCILITSHPIQIMGEIEG